MEPRRSHGDLGTLVTGTEAQQSWYCPWLTSCVLEKKVCLTVLDFGVLLSKTWKMVSFKFG
jgi:hypothetical protein